MSVLANPLVIAIIIGIVASIMKKSKQQGSGAGRQGQNRMPSFGGDSGQRRPAWAQPRQPETARQSGGGRLSTSAPMQEARDPWEEDDEDWLPRERSTAAPSSKEASRSASGGVVGDLTAAQGSLAVEAPPMRAAGLDGDEKRSPSPSADDLRRAVVWSEILGAPRSRQPYARRAAPGRREPQ